MNTPYMLLLMLLFLASTPLCFGGLCGGKPSCPPVELIFVLDTSSSMQDEARTLCSHIDNIVDELQDSGIDFVRDPDTNRPEVLQLGIAWWNNDDTWLYGHNFYPDYEENRFTCLSSDVTRLYAPADPEDEPYIPFVDSDNDPNYKPYKPSSSRGCRFPTSGDTRDEVSVDDGNNNDECWGPAIAMVAARHPWRSNSVRLVTVISDEGPCNGSPLGTNQRSVLNAADWLTVRNAMDVAAAHKVIVSPILGTIPSRTDPTEIAWAMGNISEATGGVLGRTQGEDAESNLVELIKHLVESACVEAHTGCDDNDPCTVNDACVMVGDEEACVGQPALPCPDGTLEANGDTCFCIPPPSSSSSSSEEEASSSSSDFFPPPEEEDGVEKEDGGGEDDPEAGIIGGAVAGGAVLLGAAAAAAGVASWLYYKKKAAAAAGTATWAGSDNLEAAMINPLHENSPTAGTNALFE
ncbi:hypothetical protein QOT17_002890 [Balamuthia mandrillaris]